MYINYKSWKKVQEMQYTFLMRGVEGEEGCALETYRPKKGHILTKVDSVKSFFGSVILIFSNLLILHHNDLSLK